MARPTDLTPELIEKARGYIATCEDSYRRFNEVEEDASGEPVEGDTQYYQQAVALARESGSIGVSHLQRGLRIGYSRASRLLDLMEEHKVVGEADGSRPREVLSPELEVPYDEESSSRIQRRRISYAVERRLDVKLPSIAGLALYLGVARSTVYTWGELKTELGLEFSDIMDEVLAEQENRLINGGISGRYSPVISKVILGKHGYSEKHDMTSGDKPIQVSPEAQALAAAALDTFLGKQPESVPGAPPQATTPPPPPAYNGNPDTPPATGQ